MALREIECEGTSLSDRTGQADLAAQQAGDLAANGQTQTRAAVTPAGAPVGLLERLEDALLLLRSDTDAGIADGERDDRPSMVECFPILAPTFGHYGHAEDDAPLLGKLESVGEEVADDLLQPLGIGKHLPRQLRIGVDDEVQSLGFSHMTEGALHVLPQLGKAQFGDI